MTSFIFVVTPENLRVCLERGVCGAPCIDKALPEARGLADISGIHPGSNILFYEIGTKAIYGVYQALTYPFLDNSPMWQDTGQIYPYRVLIGASAHTFHNPINLSDLYDLRDENTLWSWLGIVQRSVQIFTDSECMDFVKLLYRNNPFGPSGAGIKDPYKPIDQKPLPVKLTSDRKGRIVTAGAPEGHLTAWLMGKLARRELKDLFGEYTDYINFLPTSYGKEMDILLLHEIKDYFFKPSASLSGCTILELKADRCLPKDLSQTIKYEDWLIKKRCNGDSEMVHSAIIAHRFDDEVIDYTRKKQKIEGHAPRLIRYQVQENDVKLQPI